ncbi:MAG: alpha/beta hydrolase [Xanthomonadales bacterium]|nr:alpha/beta hydrolase [Xanthomonadales bacterium]
MFAACLVVMHAKADAQSEVTQEPAGTIADPARYQTFVPPLQFDSLQRGLGLRVYLPPGYASGTRRYPVLYLFDGQNLFDARTSYAGEWEVDEALDLEFRRSGFAAIVVGIDHGGERRINELSAWPDPQFGAGDFDAVLAELVHVLKPFVDASYRTRSGRDATLIGGSSLGGLAALYAVLQRPQTFGRAMVFSPSLWISEQAFWLARRAPGIEGSRVYLYAGTAEGDDMVDAARRMQGVLQGRSGVAVRLGIGEGQGHNEAAWRVAWPDALRWLFRIEEQAGEKD